MFITKDFADAYCRKEACPGYSDEMGYGVFELGILKWDQWKENSKYLIPYDDSELIETNDNGDSLRRLATLKTALEKIELVSSLKFVHVNSCLPGDPCSSGLKKRITIEF